MSVKRRLTGYSGMRVDWPHVRSIESSVSFDFDSVLRGMVTGLDSPFLIRGFDIRIPDAAVSANSLQVDVADTAILHSTAGESGTIFTIPNGTPADVLNSSNSKVVGAFQNGVPNYVSIELIRATDPDSADQTAGWSEAQQSEFQRTVPIGSILDYRYIITTSGFSTNLPLYIVGVSSTGAIEYIQNSKTNLFRLGRGGTSPDPFFSFDFGGVDNDQNALDPRREWINESPSVNPNPVTAVPGDDPLAFRYGDFSITSLKEWMDAIMTRFKEITGSSYWYTDSTLLGNPINTFDLWWDSVGSLMTGAGNISYNLILETTDLSSGFFQTPQTNPDILPGDSFIEGAISGNKATLQTFNNTQLVINSLTREDFVFDEELRNRRLFRPNLSEFELIDDVDVPNSERVAILKRLSTASTSGPFTISSATYSGNVITITTSSAHGYEVGDNVLIEGISNTSGNPNEVNRLLPNGVHLVKEVLSTTSFQYTAQFEPLGTLVTTGASLTSKDGIETHPYLPRKEIISWEVDGSDVLIEVQGHSFVAGDIIVVSGTNAASDAPNGRHTIINIESDRKIRFTPTAVPGTPVVTGNELCRYDSFTFILTVTGAEPDTYTVTNIQATAWSDTQLSYVIGPDALPTQGSAFGAITLDGAIAYTTVANPVKVLRIDNDGSGNLLVTTDAPHGLSANPGPKDYTIYGDTSLSPYIRTYENIAINSISAAIQDITKNGTAATGLLTVLDNTFNGGEKVVIDGVELIEGIDWSVGGSATDTATNIAGAINGNGSLNTILTATPNLNTVEIDYNTVGVTGNSITTAIEDEGATVNLQWSGETLSGGTSYLEVTSTSAHGFFTGNQIEVTGNAEVSFNGTFDIGSIESTTVFRLIFNDNGTLGAQAGGTATNNSQYEIAPIVPGGTVILPPPNSYVNPGNDDTYAIYPDNPYPGPIQWSDDIFIKGIVGDRFFRIPKEATAGGTSTANRFNVNGLTGTAYLQDGEVAYIELERGKEVSNGATYTSTSNETIVGTEPPKDEAGNFLVAGDFVKFESDSEANWIRIAGTYGTEITGNVIPLESDNGQPPTIEQRPAASGRLLYAKTTYNEVTVQPHWKVTPTPDMYWLAVRRDNGSPKSKVYFKSLELEQGEVREINDNELSNHLTYTGAKTEAAVNPNYTVIDANGIYGPSQIITVGSNPEDIDIKTRQITFITGPELGFEKDDKITFIDSNTSLPVTYTVNYLISSRTIIVQEDISTLQLGQDVTFIRDNYKIQDSDNLTLAIRKSDRESARINTALERPVYDESAYPQLIPVSGTGTIKAGSYIYQGDVNNPSALAWVLHGTTTIAEKIEGFNQDMPGGHPSTGPDAVLVVIYSGAWSNGSAIFQNGTNTGRTVNNPGDPVFDSPELAGGASGIEIVLPPNRRTEVKGSEIVVWPSHSIYKASLEDNLAGEELMVIANDTIRQANVDYEETFGGPKAKIKIVRPMPPNTRLRFRVMAAFGSALAKLAGNVSLQLAYEGGSIISTISGTPVDIRAADSITGGAALKAKGSIEIDGQGSGSVVGGIFGPRTPLNTDQAFLIGKEDNKPKETWTGEDYVKTHTGYTGSAWTRKTGSGVSVGSSGDSLSSTAITVPTGKSARIMMNATANKTGGLGVASFRIEGTFYNTGSGAQIAGSPVTYAFGGAGDGDFYAVAFGITGDDVTLVVFGTDGSTIQWVAGIDYQIIEGSI